MGCAVEEYAAAGQGECKDMGEDRPGMISLWCRVYLPIPSGGMIDRYGGRDRGEARYLLCPSLSLPTYGPEGFQSVWEGY